MAMPISPIDFISIAPRSQDIAQQQAGQGDRVAHANEAVSVQYQQQVEHNSRQTVQKSNADNNRYRYDAKEKGNNSYQGKGGKKKKKDGEKEQKPEPGSFDVKF